jgi:hypothetical protein
MEVIIYIYGYDWKHPSAPAWRLCQEVIGIVCDVKRETHCRLSQYVIQSGESPPVFTPEAIVLTHKRWTVEVRFVCNNVTKFVRSIGEVPMPDDEVEAMCNRMLCMVNQTIRKVEYE